MSRIQTVVFAAMLIALAAVASAGTFNASNSDELIAAIANANAALGADTIVVAPGSYLLSTPLDVTDALTIDGPPIAAAVIDGAGFAVQNQASLTISNLTVRNATGVNVVNGDLTLRGVTIDCKFVSLYVRGVWTQNGSTATLENSSITRCVPGIQHDSSASVVLKHVTITNNDGGVENWGFIRAENSAIFGNFERQNCFLHASRIQSGSGNLDSDGSCWQPGSSNLTVPLYDVGISTTLADNGGPTPTFAVFGNSPAIDAGDPALCLPFDQRGVLRAQGTNCDIGAFEFNLFSPQITSLSPLKGPVGTTVTITGTNLAGVATVVFGGNVAAIPVSTTDTTVVVRVPEGATSGAVVVSSAAGAGISASEFTVLAPPSVAWFDPLAGQPGDAVTIHGANFVGTTDVSFGGVPAAFSVLGPTEIRAQVPVAAVTGVIAVTTPNGTGVTSDAFKVLHPPSIAAFTPAYGLAGATVVITGTNFAGTTSVAFGGTAASFSTVSAIEIDAQVPAGAITGLITVATADGTASSPTVFRIAADFAGGTIGGGETVSTLGSATEATAADPVETSVTHPTGGDIEITEQASSGAFGVVGQLVKITVIPWTTATNPLVIVFRLDASIIPPGQDATTIIITKDGVAVPPCTGPAATPDPCVSSRLTIGDDAVITIFSSSASDWEFVAAPPRSTVGRAWGGGVANGAHFDFNVSQRAGESVKGHLHFDDGHGMTIDSRQFASLAVAGNTATIRGTSFTVVVTDRGDAGDVFWVTTTNGYTFSGVVTSGSIKVE